MYATVFLLNVLINSVEPGRQKTWVFTRAQCHRFVTALLGVITCYLPAIS